MKISEIIPEAATPRNPIAALLVKFLKELQKNPDILKDFEKWLGMPANKELQQAATNAAKYAEQGKTPLQAAKQGMKDAGLDPGATIKTPGAPAAPATPASPAKGSSVPDDLRATRGSADPAMPTAEPLRVTRDPVRGSLPDWAKIRVTDIPARGNPDVWPYLTRVAAKATKDSATAGIIAADAWHIYNEMKQGDLRDPEFREQIAKQITQMLATDGSLLFALYLGGAIGRGATARGGGEIPGMIAGALAAGATDVWLGSTVDQIIDNAISKLYGSSAASPVKEHRNFEDMFKSMLDTVRDVWSKG